MASDLFEILNQEVNICPTGEDEKAAAILATGKDVVARGHNNRMSTQDPLRYAAMDCISNAGRRNDQATLTLYLSRAPNWLEAGTIVQFGIGAVVLAFGVESNEQIEFLRDRGVRVGLGTQA